jgi:hypothetical protein
MAIHGDLFLQNVKDLIKKVADRGGQGLRIEVSPDILRRYPKEIQNIMKPPLMPGSPPSFFGYKLVQNPNLPQGSVRLITQEASGGLQEIKLGFN